MSTGMILGIVGALLLCCVCLPTGGGLGFVMHGGGLAGVSGAAQRTQTVNNAKQIALAMHTYNDMNRTLPSQRAAPGDLSWRVSILPFVEQGPLFNQFDKNGAWNRPPNQALLSQRPKLYETPLHPVLDDRGTRFQYFTGQKTLFPDPLAKPKIADMPDGTSNTAMFAESSGPVGWSMPADMTIMPAGALPLPNDTFVMAFGDGSARPINRSKVNDQTLRMLIDPRDGMALPGGVFD